jgi:anhydro-N-acetylmuramic acid kinase
MNPQIHQLYKIAQKPSRLIIGLMSGTSVDGLDIALCKLTGTGNTTQVALIQFETFSYNDAFKNNIASIFSKRSVDLEAVCLINEWVGITHGKMILTALQKWNIKAEDIDAIASHGQTIYHAPKWMHKQAAFTNATLQIGDGDHLAVTTGIITLSDFRQKHVAAGGEGAPLAVYGDYLIFGKRGENRVMLNIGGIANFTYLPASMNANEVFSTDVGPGNTIMDAYCKKYFHCAFDENAQFALQGKVCEPLVEELLQNEFIQADFPKTTGPELFNLEYLVKAQQKTNTTDLTPVDVIATLNKFSASVIINALKKTIGSKTDVHIYSSGGGMHNPLLMQQLQTALPSFYFHTTDVLHINPDAKEAVLFAILANETLAGNTAINSQNSAIPNVYMGKISLPK